MHNFRRLVVWNKAVQLATDVYTSTSALPASERYGLSQQMRRAAVSIASNIAEASGSGTSKAFARYLRVAYGSACELETQLQIGREVGWLDEIDVRRLIGQTEEVRRMLYTLIRRNTGIGAERSKSE